MTLNIDLKPNEINTIKDILGLYLPKKSKIWVFGSRTKGNAKPFSDIDLLIDLGRSLTIEELSSLTIAFDDSLLPYKVDIADAAVISPLFKKTIRDQLVPLS